MTRPTPSTLEAAVRRTIGRLTTVQHPSGSFPTLWSHWPDLRSPRRVESPFVTAMILLAVWDFPVEAGSLRRRSLGCLRSSRDSEGWVRFLAGMDPDLDDTALVNSLLQAAGRRDPGCRRLARQLLSLQREDGLYFTWRRSTAGASNDVDPCVTVNVMRLLHQNALPLESALSALRRATLATDYERGTLYYEPSLSLPYWVSTLPQPLRERVLAGHVRETLLHRASTAAANTCLDVALALFVRLRCGEPARACLALADHLLQSEEDYGAWPPTAFFRAFDYWGSSELVSAVVAQSLSELRSGLVAGA